MRDIHQLKGRKEYIEDFTKGITLVRKLYPNATAEGSLGCYSFWVNGEVIAEAWLHRDKPGWWLRIKNMAGEGGNV